MHRHSAADPQPRAVASLAWPSPRSRRHSAWRRSASSSRSSRTTFDPASLRERIAALETQMGAPGFWDDPEAAGKVGAEHARLNRRLETYESLTRDVDDLDGLTELAAEDEDLAGGLRGTVASGRAGPRA